MADSFMDNYMKRKFLKEEFEERVEEFKELDEESLF